MDCTAISVTEQLERRYRLMVCARNPKSGRNSVTIDRYMRTGYDEVCDENGVTDSVTDEVLIADNHELHQFVRGFLLRDVHPTDPQDEYWLTTQIREAAKKADRKGDAAAKARPFHYADLSEMAEWEDIESEYAAENLIPLNESVVIAGPAKTLKTTLTGAHLGICLVAGKSYLGRFGVPHSLSVDFFSAESGLKVLARNSRRIAESIGVPTGDVGNLLRFHDRVPHLNSRSDLVAIEQHFDAIAPDVAIFDPLNRMLPPEALTNVYAANQMLDRLVTICRERGITPIFVHHAKKTSIREGEPMGLEDLAGAGIPEFFRAWILLSRRTPYRDDGHHALWLSAGGSAGHNVRLAVDVTERESDGSPCWRVQSRTPAELEAAQRELKQAEQQKRKAKSVTSGKDRIVQVLTETYPDGETKTVVKNASGLNGANFTQSFGALITAGAIQTCEVTRAGRTYTGYRITESPGTPTQTTKKETPHKITKKKNTKRTRDNPGQPGTKPGTARG